jgi:uncharacterized protein (DUF2147 family)
MALLIVLAAAAAQHDTALGRWHTSGNKAVVEIAPCGNRLCGTIISAAPLPATGAPPKDSRNPDPALRNRSMIGVKILNGFARDGRNWTGGTIYNPTNGKTYRSQLMLAPGGQLKVSGCVAIFCQTQIWRRVQ